MNVNVERANGYANTQQANNRHNVQKVSKTLRAKAKKAHHANKAQKTHRANKAQSAQKAQRANNTQNTVSNKVRINAQELFKTMTVTPAKTFDQNAGDMDKANGNKPATPPEATVKTAKLAAKVNTQNKALRTPPGQADKKLKNADKKLENADKKLKNADKRSQLWQLAMVEQPIKDIDEFVKAYKNIAKFQTNDQEHGILELSNRMEIISYLYWQVEEADLRHPLGNFINSNLRITKAIDRGGDVRTDFNPVTSAYKAVQNGYESQEAGVNKFA